MNILVIMSDNRPLDNKNYPSLTASINKNYCLKHGYEFMYFQPTSFSSDLNRCCLGPSGYRHCAWTKLLSLKIAMEGDADYVVYIDSDAIFKDFSKRIEEVMDIKNNHLVFVNDYPWGPEKANAGFFACKNCKETKEFLQQWWTKDVNAQEFPWEQKALWQVMETTQIKIDIIQHITCLEHPGQFVRHVTNGDKDQKITNKILREPYFSTFILNNSLPNVLSQIKGFSYLTV